MAECEFHLEMLLLLWFQQLCLISLIGSFLPFFSSISKNACHCFLSYLLTRTLMYLPGSILVQIL